MSDQMMGFYNISCQSIKRVFAHIVGCAEINAYVLGSYCRPTEHMAHGRKKSDCLTLRLELAEELIRVFSS